MPNSQLPAGFQIDQPGAGAAPQGGQGALPPGFELDSQRLGGIGGQAAAAAAGAARTMTLGLSDQALTKSGLVSPDTLQALQTVNPVSSFVGEAGGLGLSHFYGVGEAEDAIATAKTAMKAAEATGNAAEIAKATEGLSAIKNTMGAGDLLNPVKAIGKIGGQVSDFMGNGLLGGLSQGAAEGALFGAGQSISDQALSDPDAMSENLMHNVGYGTLFGAGGMGLLGLGAKAVEKISGAIGPASDVVKKASAAVDQILNDTPRSSAPILEAEPVAGVQPTSIQDLVAKNAKAIANGEAVEMPEKAALESALSRVPMDNPVHPMQIDSLNSQGARDTMKIAKEMPGEVGDAIRGTEARQKAELLDKTDQAIQDIAPEHKPVANAVKNGQEAIDAFTDQYQDEKKTLIPIMNQLKEVVPSNPFDHVGGLVDSFSNAVPSVSRMFDTSGKEIAFNKYSTSFGIDKATYSAVKEAVEAVKDHPATIEELMNIRQGMSQHVDVLAQGPAAGQIRALRASMMDYIQNQVGKASPEMMDGVHIRDIFRRYAINEQQREVIEKMFGASVGSTEFGAISKIKPENVLDNMFKNTATVKAAKEILGPEKFAEVLQNHLAEKRALMTKDGAFSSNKFWSYLRGNQDALNEGFADHMDARQKIKDYNTIMRILPDTASVNPSGTAKTLVGALSLSPGKLLDNLREYGAEKFLRRQQIDEINLRLAGKSDAIEKQAKMASISSKVGNQIKSGIKNIFGAAESSAGFIGSKLSPSSTPEDHQKYTSRIAEMANNPTAMMNKLSQSTDSLYSASPQVASSMQNQMMRTTQFLASKIPQNTNQGPLSDETMPSKSEISSFDRYRNIVENPVSVLAQVKHGLLTAEAMETMNTVYPKMLNQMRQEIFSQMSSMKDRESIPYQTKLTLSRFMGEPLSPSLQPQSVMASQMVYAQPSSSQQAQGQPKQKQALGNIGKISLGERSTLRPQDNV